MACKNDRTLTHTITVPNSGARGPTGSSGTKTESRIFKIIVDSCTAAGNTELFDITDSKNPPIKLYDLDYSEDKPVITPTTYTKNLPDITQKEILDVNAILTKNVIQARTTLNDQAKAETGIDQYDGNKSTTIEDVLQNSVIPNKDLLEFNLSGIPDLEGTERDLPEALRYLYYPEAYKEYNQDYIQFKVYEYKTRIYSDNGFKRLPRYFVGEKGETIKEKFLKSTVILPIQGGIGDANSVNWNADQMNAIMQAASFASMSQATGDIKEVSFSQIMSAKDLLVGPKTNTGISMYLHSLFARMAVSSENNFFSRAFGSILNPNLELLFQNAELRSFAFRFDLTPRDDKEAEKIRRIIRVFKQTMAVRQGVADIFLKTPMIYEISYINGKNDQEHKSINKIKLCALRSFNVNYTPNNQYMTYNDDAATMSSYSLDMQFAELEPVYYNDYKGLADDQIGY